MRSWPTGSASSRRVRKPLRVLIVDDSATLRRALGHILAALGHAVVGEAGDVATGRALAAQTRPDVVAIDGRLPDNGALELIGALCSEHPGMHAIVIASLDETTLVRAAKRAGARAALLRPYTRTRVSDTLREATS